MPQEQLSASSFSPNVRDFLAALHRHDVKYLIVGDEAVIYYGHVRLTGDIDLFYEPTEDNVRRLYAALREFWEGEVPGIESERELLQPGLVVQFGVPPNRIDLVSRIDGVAFSDAWLNRREVRVRDKKVDIPVWFVGLKDLVLNKRAAGRPKDIDDLRFLERLEG